MEKKFKKKLRLVRYTETLWNETNVWYEIQKNWILGFIPSKFHLIEFEEDRLKYYKEDEAIREYHYYLKHYKIVDPTIKTEILGENTKD